MVRGRPLYVRPFDPCFARNWLQEEATTCSHTYHDDATARTVLPLHNAHLVDVHYFVQEGPEALLLCNADRACRRTV